VIRSHLSWEGCVVATSTSESRSKASDRRVRPTRAYVVGGVRSGVSEQQVPHWAFSPVRNDIPFFAPTFPTSENPAGKSGDGREWHHFSRRRRPSVAEAGSILRRRFAARLGAWPSWAKSESESRSRSKADGRMRPSLHGRGQGRRTEPALSLPKGVSDLHGLMWLAVFVVARVNSRFLTGLSARFGMTSLF
jgi:hypothetical protein